MKMAEPSGGGPGPGGEGEAGLGGPGGALIRVTVKTPKDKEEIVIADGASVREVGAGAGLGGVEGRGGPGGGLAWG